MRKIILSIFIQTFFVVTSAFGQAGASSFASPFDFDLYLSGNFAELRSNHFHAGLDFKTQGVSGKPILAPADGYISRVKVMPGGYGNALYVVHDNGFMTVYGHLHRFVPAVEKIVRAKQYEDENFAVDISFAPDELRVEQGALLAYAGNTGYSFGPHLHFEVREANGEVLLNPLEFYKKRVADNRPPVAQEIAVYALDGAVCGEKGSVRRGVVSGTLQDTLTVWGCIGFAIKGVDYMSGTHNKYGIYEIELYVDDSLRFSSRADKFSYSENRLINAWADYDRLMRGEGWFLRSFILPNNPLRMLSADAADGRILVDEERLYNIEYKLRDYHGNTSRCKFVVRGEKCDAQPSLSDEGRLLRWYVDNKIMGKGLVVSISRGSLFEDARVAVECDTSPSPVYRVSRNIIPLWHAATLSIDVPPHLLPLSDKCYIARVNGKSKASVGGKCEDGKITARVYVLDAYTVEADTLPPSLKAVKPQNWAREGKIIFTLSDKNTGVKAFKGFIDGEFVLFEYSSKTKRLVCNLKREKVSRGVHNLKVTATDNVGNEVVYEKTIKY